KWMNGERLGSYRSRKLGRLLAGGRTDRRAGRQTVILEHSEHTGIKAGNQTLPSSAPAASATYLLCARLG
ncbi:hypothetical protein NQZ68_018507, partial [Dissostichus eleginoides]